MSSPCARLLDRASEVLAEAIAEQPALSQRFGFLSMLLKQLAGDVDGHTAAQLAQLNGMQALLRRAQQMTPAPAVPHLDELVRFAPASPSDYRIDVLESHVIRLKHALIEVQAWAEAAEGPDSKELLRETWTYLDQQATPSSRLATQMW